MGAFSGANGDCMKHVINSERETEIGIVEADGLVYERLLGSSEDRELNYELQTQSISESERPFDRLCF